MLCQNHYNVNKSHGGHRRINQNQSYSEIVSMVASHEWCRLCIEPLFGLTDINRNELFEPLHISDMPPEHWENITLRTSVARFPWFYCMMVNMKIYIPERNIFLEGIDLIFPKHSCNKRLIIYYRTTYDHTKYVDFYRFPLLRKQ